MGPTLITRILFVAATSLLVAGCNPGLYRAETVLNADGTIRREIYQPAKDTPSDAARPENWSGVTFAERIEDEKWRGKISGLPAAERDKKRDYFAAWGEFDAPDHMPQTFVKEGPAGLPSGVLAIDYARNDCVFVVEHQWRETLTDIVTLDDLHLARRELADLLLPMAEKILAEGFGEEYDVSGLVDWLHNTATPAVFEMTDVLFDVRSRGQGADSELFLQSFEPVLGRHGLKLRDASGEPLKEEELAIKQFAKDVVAKHVRRHDGEPVPSERIEELLVWLTNNQVEGDPTVKANRFADSAKRVIAEKYGTFEAFGEALAPLVARILGLYNAGILATERRFDYAMQVPGTIVETNGLLLADNRTRWKFEAGDAYPDGFAMHCRSLAEQSELQQQVFGKRVLDDRAKMLRFVEITRGNTVLLDTLRQCVKAKSPQPLLDARDRTAPAGPDTPKFDAVIELLGVKP